MPQGIYKNLLLDQLATRLHIQRADLAELAVKKRRATHSANFGSS